MTAKEEARKIVTWLRQCPPLEDVVVGFIAEKLTEAEKRGRDDERQRIISLINCDARYFEVPFSKIKHLLEEEDE